MATDATSSGATSSDATASDDRLQLAYDAGTAALSQQDTTLGNLRGRATALLTIAALATSFATAIGLVNPSAGGTGLPDWAAYTMLALLCLIGATVMLVLWPVSSFSFGPDSGDILNRYAKGESIDDILRSLSEAMTHARDTNATGITLRMHAFEIGGLLLLAEVIVLVVAVVVR
jgi:hypothetical protein